jgi:hypothetical protein
LQLASVDAWTKLRRQPLSLAERDDLDRSLFGIRLCGDRMGTHEHHLAVGRSVTTFSPAPSSRSSGAATVA